MGGIVKRRGAPTGHPPYRKAVLTARLQILMTPELRQQIEAAAKQANQTVLAWCRDAFTQHLDGNTPSGGDNGHQ
jgi:hypothetical protein